MDRAPTSSERTSLKLSVTHCTKRHCRHPNGVASQSSDRQGTSSIGASLDRLSRWQTTPAIESKTQSRNIHREEYRQPRFADLVPTSCECAYQDTDRNPLHKEELQAPERCDNSRPRPVRDIE